MNFGPLVPQEVDGMVKFLEQNGIPFEIHFNQEDAKKELEPSPLNNLQGTEFRTKTYLAQHFYIEVPDEFLINNPKVEGQILKYITKHDFEDVVRTDDDNVVHIDEENILKAKNERTKWIQRIFALLFLAAMLYGIIQSIFQNSKQ